MQESFITDILIDHDNICLDKNGSLFIPNRDGLDAIEYKHISLMLSLRGGRGEGLVDRTVSVNFEVSLDRTVWFNINHLVTSLVTQDNLTGPITATGNLLLTIPVYFDNFFFNYFRILMTWDGEPSVDKGFARIVSLRRGYIYENLEDSKDQESSCTESIKQAKLCGRCGNVVSQVVSEGLFGKKYTGLKCNKCGWVG